MPEDNPISAMMALKHPETVKAVEDATINEMAESHNSNPNRFVGMEWKIWLQYSSFAINSETIQGKQLFQIYLRLMTRSRQNDSRKT